MLSQLTSFPLWHAPGKVVVWVFSLFPLGQQQGRCCPALWLQGSPRAAWDPRSSVLSRGCFVWHMCRVSRALSGSWGREEHISNTAATRSRKRLQWLWVPAEVGAAFRRLCKDSRVLPQLQKSWSVHINVKVRVLVRSLTLSLLFGQYASWLLSYLALSSPKCFLLSSTLMSLILSIMAPNNHTFITKNLKYF